MRSLPERIAVVRACSFFSGVAEVELTGVAERLTERSFVKGGAVFRAGDPSDALFLIARGQVSIRSGSRVLVTLSAPECFGELGALAREPRSADAVCEASCELLRLATADLHTLLAQRPALQQQVLVGLVRRVKEAGSRAQ